MTCLPQDAPTSDSLTLLCASLYLLSIPAMTWSIFFCDSGPVVTSRFLPPPAVPTVCTVGSATPRSLIVDRACATETPLAGHRKVAPPLNSSPTLKPRNAMLPRQISTSTIDTM